MTLTVVFAKLPAVQDFAAVLGRNVRIARQERGWSREQLAVRSRLSLATIYRLETGKHAPQYGTLRAVAKALKTSMGALTMGNGEAAA